MTRQLPLKFRRSTSFARSEFVSGPSNTLALAALDAWPTWHTGCLALVGPEGAGKTHLARIWAARADAVVLDRTDLKPAAAVGRPALVEDVDRGADAEALFHLINMAGHEGGGLLLTARIPPVAWPADLPDLRSRLNAMPVAEIAAPDDEVLEGVLRKLFRERSIRPPSDIYPYLLRRMERSVPAARDIVARLDEVAGEENRPITRALARQILDGDADNIDLFEG